MKKILLLIFFFATLIFPKLAHADGNFTTSLDSTYIIDSSGLTHVTIKGQITNNTDKFFPMDYTLRIGFENIQNVKAQDLSGSIIPKFNKIESGQEVMFPFHYKAVGIGSTNRFTFAFDTPDVAKKVGQIWEVNIPGVENQADFKDFTVHIQVPQDFGQPAYVKPVQIGNSLDFDKNSLGNGGVSMAFGQIQSYDFVLTYQLKNNNFFPTTQEVALPSNTNYQTVEISKLTPQPKNVRLDTDGNWLASYQLYPGQEINVTAKVNVLLSLLPKTSTLTQDEITRYTESQPFWDASNGEVKKLAQDLKTPRSIYDYVVNHIKYDYSQIAGTQSREGALGVLSNSATGVCLEFADLFTAIARAAGIPAREVAGFAYSDNKKLRPLSLTRDILHVWPEYYDHDRESWIMVDPTWENTTRGIDYFATMDFDHVAFVVKGAKSDYPIPAGGYKNVTNGTGKDIQMSFGQETTQDDPQITMSLSVAQNIIAGFPVYSQLIVRNVGNTQSPQQSITINSSVLGPKTQTVILPNIPPFGEVNIPVSFNPSNILTNEHEIITIQVAGNTISKEVIIQPFFLQKVFIYGGLAIVILSIIIFFLATSTGSVSVLRKRR